MMARDAAPTDVDGLVADGDVVERLGRYELLRRLGAGGMAEVHLARAAGPEGFQKLVVLKRILPHLSADPEFVRMFLAEARLAAILDHPNVVQVFDIGRDGGDWFFTMEYVYGENLQTVLRAVRRHGGGALPIEHAVTIGIGVASGLNYAHERVGFDGRPLQLVHRDVSPTNVMCTYDGCVKVADFGIAKVTSRTDVTRAGIRKGKVPYMSPEQCRAEPLDRRSDVFSLGIVLYEATTDVRLYDGDNEFGVMNRIVNVDVPPPSAHRANYPKDLERIIMRALCRDRDRRYTSAAELALDLEAFARERKLRCTPAALGEYLHAVFTPKPFPYGALIGTVVAPPSLIATGTDIGGTPNSVSSMPAMAPDLTPASHPSSTFSSRVGPSATIAPPRDRTLRNVAIGLGACAGVAVLALGALFATMQLREDPPAPPAAAVPTPAVVAPTPSVAAPVPTPTPVPLPAAVPTPAQPDPVVAAPPPAEVAPDDDAEPVIADTPAPVRKPKPKKKKDRPSSAAETKSPDLDAFLPQ